MSTLNDTALALYKVKPEVHKRHPIKPNPKTIVYQATGTSLKGFEDAVTARLQWVNPYRKIALKTKSYRNKLTVSKQNFRSFLQAQSKADTEYTPPLLLDGEISKKLVANPGHQVRPYCLKIFTWITNCRTTHIN